MPGTPPYLYTTTSEDYRNFLSELAKSKVIGLDLEFDRNRYGYGFTICLIQCYIETTCYIVDPLLLEIPLDDFYSILESDHNEIICFSFSEDYKLLKLSGCSPTNVRDLNIACSLLNYPIKSLVNVLLEHLGIETSKASQKSNWLARPLSNKQLEYAAEDVLYLNDLYQLLKEHMILQNRYEWFLSENEWHYTLPVDHDDLTVKVKNKDLLGLNEHQAHIFKGLFEWRDEMAKDRNKPPYQMVDNHYLKLLVLNPHKIKDWLNENAIHHSLKTYEVQQWLKVLMDNLRKESRDLGLSETRDALQPMSQEEYQRHMRDKRAIKEAKNNVFGTLKDRLIKAYGRHVQSYLLSNRVVEEIVMGKKNIPPYRYQVFRDLVGINFDNYLPKHQ